jgi:formylglycine-generating enzyme required for sulfatase activity
MIGIALALVLSAVVDDTPCAPAPVGMVCVKGGEAIVGADDATPAERPRRSVRVPTFYVDTHEVTMGDYQKCERAGACPRLPRPPYYAKFQKAELPAVPVSWEHAHQYCVFVGKRLPSEAEWEKAARGGPEGRTYAWGNEPASCERAMYKGCKPDITRAPGSFAAGAYGVFDMSGNGYEWVKDWWTPCATGCARQCGDACTGDDPRGPCGGAAKCKGMTKRTLKGGSWYWPAEMTRGAWRRGENPKSGLHRLSFRCASSFPWLASWPPNVLKNPRARAADPAPPTADELAKFRDVTEDTDIFAIPTCKRQGLARVDCRDPMSYIRSNEALSSSWGPAIANIGGGYVGLGADQSYSFIAHARSTWAWLFDYDPTVVRIHHIIRAVVNVAETRAAFVKAFTTAEKKRTLARIDEEYASLDDAERDAIRTVFSSTHKKLWSEYARQMKPQKWKDGFGWLSSDENYAYIRLLMTQGRIQSIKGNMLTDRALPSIALSARALGVPIRVYYPSNAEEQWKQLPAQYGVNIRALPFDDDSVVLRTLVTRQFHTSSSKWHYLVHGGLHFQRWIAVSGYENVWRFMEDRQRPGEFSSKVASTPVDAGAPKKRKAGLPPPYLHYIGVKGAP